MWSPTEYRFAGPGWVETPGLAIRVDVIEITVSLVPVVNLSASFRTYSQNHALESALGEAPFLRLIVRDKHDFVIAAGARGPLTRSSAGPAVSGELRCLQISRERQHRSTSALEVSYAVRLAPSLLGIAHSPLRDGLLASGAFSRDKTAQVSVRCGDIDLWAGIRFASEPLSESQSPSLHIVEQHLIEVSRAPRAGETTKAVIHDLEECSEFLLALLTCLSHSSISAVSSELTYRGPNGTTHIRQALHPTDRRVTGSPRHTSCDLILFRVLQAAASAWPSTSAVIDAVHTVAGTFGQSMETSFLARHTALEALAHEWLNRRGGLRQLEALLLSGGDNTPRKRNGRPHSWKPEWNSGFTPPLSVSLWCMLDNVGVEWVDQVTPPSAGPPDFVELRNEIMHGSHVRNTARIEAAAHVVGVLSLRVVAKLLDLPDLPERGCNYWFSQAGQQSSELIPMPEGFLDPLGVDT